MTDPAETARLVKAPGTQGSRLAQHEAALTDMGNNLQAMFTQQKDLVAAVQSLTNQLATLTTSPDPAPDPLRQHPPPLQPAHHSEPRIPAPERYNGDLGTCGPFLTQCSLLFEHQPQSSTSDRSRIAYLVNLLKGPALEWASAVWDQQTPICNSNPNFVLEMRKIFDHPVRGRDAAKRLQILRQGSRAWPKWQLSSAHSLYRVGGTMKPSKVVSNSPSVTPSRTSWCPMMSQRIWRG